MCVCFLPGFFLGICLYVQVIILGIDFILKLCMWVYLVPRYDLALVNFKTLGDINLVQYRLHSFFLCCETIYYCKFEFVVSVWRVVYINFRLMLWIYILCAVIAIYIYMNFRFILWMYCLLWSQLQYECVLHYICLNHCVFVVW